MKTFIVRCGSAFSAITLMVACVITLLVPVQTSAATDPVLGAAGSFSIVAQTAITGTATISGDVGLNSSGAGITALTDPDVAGTIYSSDGIAPSAAILSASVQADLSTAYTSNIPGQAADDSIGPALDGLTVTPGVHDIGAGRLNGGVLTLSGQGIYIFRASSDLISSGSIVLTNGARACDVYWRVETLATINGSSFVGTILAGTGVHIGAGVDLNGRALAVGGDVTLLGGSISGPTCAPIVTTLNIVKTVINNNGGSKVIADFPLFIDGGAVTSGVANTVSAGVHTVSETTDTGYTSVIGGDCAADGTITMVSGDVKTCTVTNDDIAPPVSSGGGVSGSYQSTIPPLIDVIKVPSPLALMTPGLVTYTFTLSNTGTVPVTDITMVDDTCSPINYISGDTDANERLDVSEVWTYRCSAMVSSTHTNIVTATGWANGITATDIANATVVVGMPVAPPLIHVTKVPSPLTLSAGGGTVTYVNKVTNPGVVPLSNVRLVDDACSPVNYSYGDTNGDSKLDMSETWTYLCQTYLGQTTVNIVTASGDANGLTARDFAMATVLVVPTKLPDTGMSPSGKRILWNVVVPIITIAALAAVYMSRKKTVV